MREDTHRRHGFVSKGGMRGRPAEGLVSLLSVSIQNLAPLPYSFCKCFKKGFGVFPANAGVCDADAVFEPGFTFFRHFLISCRPTPLVTILRDEHW